MTLRGVGIYDSTTFHPSETHANVAAAAAAATLAVKSTYVNEFAVIFHLSTPLRKLVIPAIGGRDHRTWASRGERFVKRVSGSLGAESKALGRGDLQVRGGCEASRRV